MTRATVIIPTYNWAPVLPYSIGSVLDQTLTDFELLVVGDGCTDESEGVVRDIARQDSRVRWINLPENTRSQSKPNNEGNRQARGEFVAYLGHDDLWFPSHLEVLSTLLHDAQVAISRAVIMSPQFAPMLSSTNLDEWIPPTSFGHVQSLRSADQLWRTAQEARVDPEYRLLSDFREGGARFSFGEVVTAIKFPALHRKDVYRTRPHAEQQRWLRRIRSEPLLAKHLQERAGNTPQWLPVLPGLVPPEIPTAAAFDLSQPGAFELRRQFKGLDP